MKQTLANLVRGGKAIIVGVDGTPSFRRRLQEMGVVVGSQIEMLEAAPFGDPLKLRVPNYVLAMRRRDAERVQVRLPQ